MGRLLFILFLVVLAVWFLKRAARRAETPRAESRAPRADELVRCVQCGVLLPRAEARMAAGALYCSEEHVRLGPSKGAR